jgi:hypothetical protein
MRAGSPTAESATDSLIQRGSSTPIGRSSRVLSGFDRVEVPGARNAFEFVFAAVVERQA